MHGAMQVMTALSMASVGRVLEQSANKDKLEKNVFDDPRFVKLHDIIYYPNADKHFNKRVSNRFLSYSAMSGKLMMWHEEYQTIDDGEGNASLLNGMAQVAKSFVELQRTPFVQNIETQYIKLVCGIGYCETGEIRSETLEAISDLLKEPQIEEEFDTSTQRTFADLKDNYFGNFLKNKGCTNKTIFEIFRKGIYSGHDLIQYLVPKNTSLKKIEMLTTLGITENIAKGILHAQYAGFIDANDYKPGLNKETDSKKTRKTSKANKAKSRKDSKTNK
jgi:hypothetical protein